MRRRGVTAALAAALLVAGGGACTGGGGGDGDAGGRDSESTGPAASTPSTAPGSTAPPHRRPASPRVTGTVADDLSTPWGLAFLPDGSALVASRDTGEIIHIARNGAKQGAGTVPGVSASGEGGLLGLAVAPAYAKDHLVYAYFTAAGDNRIVRMKLEGGRLGTPDLVLDGIPRGFIHNGGRIAFGPDGMLYAGTGESGEGDLSQDKGSLGGKILRMTPRGDPAPGNPFPGSVVYSYGHRNVQGLAWDDHKRLWAAEFGQNEWDELNLVRPGKNYGWPEVEGKGDDPRFVNPVAQWGTDVASPSGIAYAAGAVWMAGLRGQRLWRIPVEGAHAGRPKAFLTGEYGRLRTVERARDGSLWLTTSNTDGRGEPRKGDDRILRLTVR